ncbi:MAG: alpha-2-macroglobulin, partial [Planctomycetes bacterium]|nr:alpha-2-macroglobulin [Planctomycetota bacterium]
KTTYEISHTGEIIVRQGMQHDGSWDGMALDGAAPEPSLRAMAPSGGIEVKKVRGRTRDAAKMELGLVSESASADFFDDGMDLGEPEEGGGSQGGPGGEITVRADFRETALWLPDIVTDETGAATGEFQLPDSTTRWQISSFAGDTGDRFGSLRKQGAVTELPLILRPQMPRFLVETDEARLSALITNNTDEEIQCNVELAVEGLEILGFYDGANLRPGTQAPLTVAARNEARLDFLVRPTGTGVATIKMTARGEDSADAVERKLPVIEHGIEALVADSGRLDGERLEHIFTVPPAKDGRTTLEIAVAPSLATTMLDALPYLTHYPYGCLEQSLSRFVPTAVAARTLEEMGLDPNFVARASFGGIEKEFSAKTQPLGNKDFEDFVKAANAGIDKIEGLQKDDGAWAWWPGGPSNKWMTAYAAWSLTMAREAGLDVSQQGLEMAYYWLDRALVQETQDVNLKAWMLFAHCEVRRVLENTEPSENAPTTFDALFEARTGLSPYGRALLTLCAKAMDKTDAARILVDNLANGVVWGDAGQTLLDNTSGGQAMKTAHWGSAGLYWHWSDGAVESTAFTLRALLAVDPDSELVAPAMSWLVKNRRGAQWKSTRDTAICVLAMCDYLKVSGEASQPIAYKVWANGELLGERDLSGEDLLVAQAPFQVPAPKSGEHNIVIERTSGEGPLYWTVSARFFSAEEPIQPRASEVFVRRDYYRLVPHDTLLKGKVFERVLLKDGDPVQSGERIEVVLTLDATNDLEYMMIRDAKPAGLEATVLQSGGDSRARQLRKDEVQKRFGEGSESNPNATERGDGILNRHAGYTGQSQWLYHELRDEAQVFYADKLERGLWEIRSTLRAEVPGTFHALPAVASAMYVPEIQGNSAEIRMRVEE